MAAASGDDEDAQGLDGGVGGLGEEKGRRNGESEQGKEESHGLEAWVETEC